MLKHLKVFPTPPLEALPRKLWPASRYLHEEACLLEAPPEGYSAVEYAVEPGDYGAAESYPSEAWCAKAKAELAKLKTAEAKKHERRTR